MAVTHTTDGDDGAFVEQVAKNIRAVLAMYRMKEHEAARAIHLNSQTFSHRMTGAARWLAIDIDRLARVLKVTPSVLLARNEQEFREALAAVRNRCFSTVPGVAGDQLEFSFLPEPVLLAV